MYDTDSETPSLDPIRAPLPTMTSTNDATGDLDRRVEGILDSAPSLDPVTGLPSQVVMTSEGIVFRGRLLPVAETDQNQGLRLMALQGIESVEGGAIRLAETLATIVQHSAYADWGYQSFSSYVEGELGVKLSQANNLVAAGAFLGEAMEADGEFYDLLTRLGTTAINEIRKAGVTPANWQEYKDKIVDPMGRPYSLRQIQRNLGRAVATAQKADEQIKVATTKAERALVLKVMAGYQARGMTQGAAIAQMAVDADLNSPHTAGGAFAVGVGAAVASNIHPTEDTEMLEALEVLMQHLKQHGYEMVVARAGEVLVGAEFVGGEAEADLPENEAVEAGMGGEAEEDAEGFPVTLVV